MNRVKIGAVLGNSSADSGVLVKQLAKAFGVTQDEVEHVPTKSVAQTEKSIRDFLKLGLQHVVEHCPVVVQELVQEVVRPSVTQAVDGNQLANWVPLVNIGEDTPDT